jgi:hypothetical protein
MDLEGGEQQSDVPSKNGATQALNHNPHPASGTMEEEDKQSASMQTSPEKMG